MKTYGGREKYKYALYSDGDQFANFLPQPLESESKYPINRRIGGILGWSEVNDKKLCLISIVNLKNNVIQRQPTETIV
jgi:hypothetical protein